MYQGYAQRTKTKYVKSLLPKLCLLDTNLTTSSPQLCAIFETYNFTQQCQHISFFLLSTHFRNRKIELNGQLVLFLIN